MVCILIMAIDLYILVFFCNFVCPWEKVCLLCPSSMMMHNGVKFLLPSLRAAMLNWKISVLDGNG